MSESILSKFYCQAKLVEHLDGCENGAYVITKEEMQDLLTTITKQSDELVEMLANMVRIVENRPDAHYLEVFERSELEDAQNLLSTIKEQKDAE